MYERLKTLEKSNISILMLYKLFYQEVYMFKEDKNKQVKIYKVAEDFSILLIREDCTQGYNWTMYYNE